MSFRHLFWPLAVAVLYLSAAGGAYAQATITSVSVPANATYSVGQNLDFTVNFDEAVAVDTTGGTPYIALSLNTGGAVQTTYLSGSGSTALVFRYTVTAADHDPDGVGVGGHIQLNGARITNSGGVDAALTLNGVGSTSGVLIANAPVAPPAPVPTLTEWAMIFLAGLLGLFGAARLGLLPAVRRD